MNRERLYTIERRICDLERVSPPANSFMLLTRRELSRFRAIIYNETHDLLERELLAMEMYATIETRQAAGLTPQEIDRLEIRHRAVQFLRGWSDYLTDLEKSSIRARLSSPHIAAEDRQIILAGAREIGRSRMNHGWEKSDKA